MKSKTAVLLVNLGTPDSPSVSDVRTYLGQFLNDPRVIDINAIARALLVNLIIVPFRAPKSAKIYKQLWSENGSPLYYYGKKVREQLQAQLGDDFIVELGMRYQNPSIKSALDRIKKQQVTKIIVMPLFPHYASSSTGSALQEVMEQISKWWVIPELAIVSQYFEHPAYMNAMITRARQYDFEKYDHILFSYHGLPERQLDKVYNEGFCNDRDCEHELTHENQYCYKAACFATTRMMVAALGLPPEKCTTAFQSRLGRDPWVKPYSDQKIEEFAKNGIKKLLVFSPAFVADCLETTVEIGHEYKELFLEHGGEELQLVESLNELPEWLDALKTMVLEKA